MSKKIYWTNFCYENIQFVIAATEQGLCYTGSLNENEEELLVWAKKRYKDSEVKEDERKLKPYTEQFIEYFQGQRQQFDFAIDYKGTPFQESVWKELQKIPYGEVCTYSDIASRIGNPKAVRAVGGAIGANPVIIVIPCHRVIGKDGSLTGFSSGMELKKALLVVEGKLYV
ncbi:methylated-DNA--[protein]-cysteine S-methyltransferase [Lysinibacillus louembei]|uniref:Methylated-DNA--[protein]-cysteine S-methyltransferase n=1 Tax=Lysinibacillus louembei TaxID=1470088 RepID=A0ABZ0RYW0_9BACI|nr:methylated-DNA--[protein]-cysteine S-methyltransferase [Lysinibacillus louembei]WPK13434.1 methylated-DNA--[protein]-cysteine S-methyltransferase [Lysinibacillus louembei]